MFLSYYYSYQTKYKVTLCEWKHLENLRKANDHLNLLVSLATKIWSQISTFTSYVLYMLRDRHFQIKPIQIYMRNLYYIHYSSLHV